MFVGKILGTAVGYWYFSITGAVLGFICGVLVDWYGARSRKKREAEVSLTEEQTELARQAFFTATFSVMGHVCRSDGPVRKEQIKHAENIMERMGLSTALRASAIRLFNEGKHPDFDLDRRIKQFRDDCENSSSLYRVFLEIQLQVALADGVLTEEEQDILLHVARVLGISRALYRQLEVLVRVSMGLGDDHSGRYTQRPRSQGQKQSHPTKAIPNGVSPDAYNILGVKIDADRATVKRAYRKLMNQHHPDKLISKGLPEEMLRLATDKTQEIQNAYEQINSAQGW